jgi:hypothetical protein
MEDMVHRFLSESPLAEKIKLPARVVITRLELSPHDVNGIRAAGAYGPVPANGEICELEIGGRRIAQGKLIRKRGGTFFKVIRPLNGSEIKEGAE